MDRKLVRLQPANPRPTTTSPAASRSASATGTPCGPCACGRPRVPRFRVDVARPGPAGPEAHPRVWRDRRPAEAAELIAAVFWLKKLVSFFLMPLPLCLALLASGSPPRARISRRAALGRRLAIAAAALLLLFSTGSSARAFCSRSRRGTPAVPESRPGSPRRRRLPDARFVAVLGGGHSDMPGMPATEAALDVRPSPASSRPSGS
jgi:hypothetical protein